MINAFTRSGLVALQRWLYLAAKSPIFNVEFGNPGPAF